MSTTSRRNHPEILQVKQTHQSHCLLQNIHTPLQTTHGQQASNHPLHTRSGPGSDLPCEDGTADFFRTRNQGFKGTTRGCIQQFWQRWSADYLQGLQQCQRWQRTVPNLQPGDLILLREDNTTPLHWPTAVITDVHPGKDGIIRVVTLRTPRGNFKRPITKICPLPRVNEK